METMYYVTRQTTQSGTATEVNEVVGRDREEAILNAKIKAYKAMENFKAEKTMVNAFIGVTDLLSSYYIVSETWESITVEEVTE